MATKKPFKIPLWAVAIIPAVIFIISILIVSSDHSPDVTHKAAIERPGYEPFPEQYYVEASAAKKWHDSRIIILIVAGFIIACAVPVLYGYGSQQDGKEANGHVVWICWVIGAILIFMPAALKWGDSRYESILLPQRYEQYKNKLDSLFPETQVTVE